MGRCTLISRNNDIEVHTLCLEPESIELLSGFDLFNEFVHIVIDIELDIHETHLFQFELVMVFDVRWKSAVDLGEDLEEHIILETQTHILVSNTYCFVVLVNHFSHSSHIIVDLRPVCMIVRGRNHGCWIILELDYGKCIPFVNMSWSCLNFV